MQVRSGRDVVLGTLLTSGLSVAASTGLTAAWIRSG